METKKLIISELRKVTKSLLKENEEIFSKARLLFTLNQDNKGYSEEFEKLHNELSHGINGDIDLALRHFKTADEFADYVANKRHKTGEYVFPIDRRLGKSDAELADSMKNRNNGF